jgi:hypothetical protein
MQKTNRPDKKEPAVLKPIVDESDRRVEKALNHHTDSIVQRIFPTDASRAAAEFKLVELNSGVEYRKQALSLAVDTRIQAIEEMCNHVLVTGKAEIRRERQEFFAEQRMALEEKLNPMIDRYLRGMEERYAKLAELKPQRLRDREEKRLNTSLDEFMDLIEELLSEFTSIIHEGVRS